MAQRTLHYSLTTLLFGAGCASLTTSSTPSNGNPDIAAIVQEIESVHCAMTQDELIADGLSDELIDQAAAFCALPMAQKYTIIADRFRELGMTAAPERGAALLPGASEERSGLELTPIWNRGAFGQSFFANELPSQTQSNAVQTLPSLYSCYYGSRETFDEFGKRDSREKYLSGIPHYSAFGLTAQSCTWHDDPASPKECQAEKGISCLWGCNNSDPVLGWHEKTFASRSDLEAEILPRGYEKQWRYPYGGSYSRKIGYGYRYQVHFQNDNTWHCEGPEPDPRFYWRAFLGGWWPVAISQWHDHC
jgi:hypothetical protein